jgi:flagellar biosynthesis chaperone FliJ
MSEIVKFDEISIKQKLNFETQLQITEKIIGTLKKVTIKDDETLKIARTTLSNALTVIDKIEEVTDNLCEPYKNIIKQINGLSDQLLDGLRDVCTKTKSNISLYQTTNINNALSEHEKAMETNQVKVDEVRIKLDFVKRIASQAEARIFGGHYELKDGTEKFLACPVKLSELTDQLTFLKEKMPSGDQIKPFEGIIDNIKKLLMTAGSHLMQYMTDKINCDITLELASIDKRISLLRINTSDEIKKSIENAEQYLKKFISGLNKEAENKLKEVAKGTRKTLKYTIDDITVVPAEYLTVDDAKVKVFMKQHDEDLKEGKQPLMGINFYIHRSVIIEKDK